MPAKRSAEMKKALRLIAKGKGPTEAARLAGVSRSGLYAAMEATKHELTDWGKPVGKEAW